jgi:altered-inheritance-of-mitochondria protein 5
MLFYQLGGFTLTASILYLSTELHTRNRVHQADLLRQQARLISNLYAPDPPLPSHPDRRIQAGIWETAKDKWNAALEREVRTVQNVDWTRVSESLEQSVGNLFTRVWERGRDGVKEVGK